MFVLELQLNRKLLLRKRRINYEELAFQVGSFCLKLFITVRLEKLGEKSYWYNVLKHSESHRLFRKCCFSLVWVSCLGPQGTRLERKCKLLWWFPVKSQMKSGTHSTDSCRADPRAHEFPHPSSLSCVYHFLLKQSLLIAWISQLLVGACLPWVRQGEIVPFSQRWWGGCSKPGGCRHSPGAAGQPLLGTWDNLGWIQNTKPPDKARIWG